MACVAVAFPTAPPEWTPSVGGPSRPRLPSFLRPVPRPPRHTAEAYGTAGREPLLADLLADPLVHLVLARDGLTVEDVSRQMHEARRKLLAG